MTFSLFLKHLGLLSAILLLLAFLMTGMRLNHTLFSLYALGVVCFNLFSIFIFFYGYNTSKSDRVFSFNNVVLASFLIKLLMSIGFLLIFEKLFHPYSDDHIFHYILIYVVYTVYEVYFLTKLARADYAD